MRVRQTELERGHDRGQANLRGLLRQRIGRELESLTERLAATARVDARTDGIRTGTESGSRAGRVALAAAQGRVRWLGQLMAGLADGHDGSLDADAAGFGSSIEVLDRDSGLRLTFTLMSGSSMDVTADQVSMESPIGAALSGARAGDAVEVSTPSGVRRFRVERVVTLSRKFGLSGNHRVDSETPNEHAIAGMQPAPR